MFCGGYLFTRLASLLVDVSYICGLTFESKDREDSHGQVFTEESLCSQEALKTRKILTRSRSVEGYRLQFC
jgi:hypothetical protein